MATQSLGCSHQPPPHPAEGSGPARTDREAEWYRHEERRWQNEVGHALLDKPYETPGSAAVFEKQWGRIAATLHDLEAGVVVEVGCGKGHLLRGLRTLLARRHVTLIGLDLSQAVYSLPRHDLPGILADGEYLPLRSGCAAALIYDGALHHVINYADGLREAIRVLAPAGVLILFEPVSSRFSRMVHRILDPLVFRRTVYESPIDQHYKHAFREERIVSVLRDNGMSLSHCRTDFLAYPFTGCYAGSVFSRREGFMRFLMRLEDIIAKTPLLGRLAQLCAWRFLIVARKSG